MSKGPYTVGVDVGGTFTDAVVLDSEGRIIMGKDLSTPNDLSVGILNSLKDAAGKLSKPVQELLAESSLFLHGSTVTENAVVTRSGVKSGLITTKGFEDTLMISRGGYGRWAGLTDEEIKHPVFTDKPEPIVPRSLIRGIGERVDYKGMVVAQLKEDEVRLAVNELVESKVQGIGVCFLWSIANPVHERTAKRIALDMFPELFVTASSDIAPVLGEFERMSTTALNAYLGPIVSTYLRDLKAKILENGFRKSLLIMQANGGLVTVAEASDRPVGLLEAGPVGGLIGSRYLGGLLSVRNIIAADMGGTTFKVGVIRDGLIEYQREPMILRYPYAYPKMDVVSIGMGGGSIVWLEKGTNVPKVGPQSAGAEPGPICYGLGGEEPTVTDMDLILGILDPEFFLGGRMKLDKEKATQIFKKKVADPLGLDVVVAASEIYKVVNEKIYDLLHKMTVERGLDPREFEMFVYGGAAGMHASTFGAELGVTRILVPYTASVHGAYGLVASDIVHEHAVSHRIRVPAEVKEVNDLFEQIAESRTDQLVKEGFSKESIAILRSLDIRYRRQVHVVTTPVEKDGRLTDADLEKVFEKFEALYEQRYGKGSAFREAGMEIVNFRVKAVGRLSRVPPYRHELSGHDPHKAFIAKRQVYLGRKTGYVETGVFTFDGLEPGNRVPGPAIVLTPVTTVMVNPGQTAYIDEYKDLFITKTGAGP